MTPNALAIAIWAAAAAAPTQPVLSVASVHALAQGEAQVMLYGLIGDTFWDGITADGIAAQLDALDVDTITVCINSRGGEVDHGTAIYNALKRHKARIVVRIDGQAGSIASLIAMAGDEVVMPPTALMMIHAPYLLAGGNAAQMRSHADRLDTTAEAMLEAYAAKTGDRDAMHDLLTDGADHWFTAARAVELGLADRVEAFDAEPTDAAAAAAMVGYLSAIAHADGAVASALRGHIQAAAEPRLFASLPDDTQQQVIAHIEDPTMKQKLQSIYAAAAGGNAPNPAAPAGTPQTPAASVTPAAPAQAAAPPSPAQPSAATADQVLAAQRDRNTEILAAARSHAGNQQIEALRDEALTNPSMSVADFNARALAILGQQAAPAAGTPRAEAGVDERDRQRTAMARAIDIRIGAVQAEGDNPFRGFTMFEMARACAERAGVNTRGMERMEVVGMAFTHSTSDFPQLLGNVAQRALRRGYEESPEVFPQFTRAVTLTDFKPTTLAGLGRFSDLDKIPEGGEYKHGSFNESGSPLRLATYGKMFSITRQAVINDDLNALADVPRKMGQAAKRTVGNAVFSILTDNPVIGDGVQLFHADHNNLVSPGTDISTATIDGMRVLMATQKDADGRTVRVPLKYVVVPVGLGGTARMVLESQFEVGASSRNNTTPNIVRNTFEVIEDPRLDAADPKAWYGVADPAFYDGIVVGYLDGRQEPYLESKQGWNIDGTEWKVRIDAAAAAVDHIALAKNPGA